MAKYDYKVGGRIELTAQEVEQLYTEGKIYLTAYRTIYEIRWSKAQGKFYFPIVYKHFGVLPLTLRGRHFAFTAKDVNNLIKNPLFNEN